jgi:hypothetical protein
MQCGYAVAALCNSCQADEKAHCMRLSQNKKELQNLPRKKNKKKPQK